MWKPEHRRTADRRGLRDDRDLSEAKWALVAPLIPPAKRCGRPPAVMPNQISIASMVWRHSQGIAF